MRAPVAAVYLMLASAGLVLAPGRRAVAADVELPPRIPTAKLAQQVGLTEVAVEYDCPAAAGRKIWGGVVPYDRPWAIGGTVGTKIRFSKDVRVGGEVVPAGSYWLVAIPGKSGWTLALNKTTEPGGVARAYKPELDVVRVKVAAKAVPRRERLTFVFSDINDDRASLDLEWEALRVSLPIQVNTTQQILASISGLDGTWRAFANAARYMLETTHDYDAGLKYVDQALALKDDWYCMWIKGALFAAKGDFHQAREWALKARDLSEQAGNGAALAPDLKTHIAEWTRRSGSGRAEAEAKVLEKTTEETALTSTAPRVVEAPLTSPASPAYRAAPEKEPAPAPPGDPPLLRRARLRHR